MSLLFLEEGEKSTSVHTDCYKDLALDELMDAITGIPADQQILRKVFSEIPECCETVRYRQQVLHDFLSNEEMCAELEEVLSTLRILKDYKESFKVSGPGKGSVWELLDYLRELEVYIKVIEEMSLVFRDKKIESKALQEMAQRIERIKSQDGISHLKKDMNELRADISTTGSLTLGVNLSPDLYPEEVKLLGFNSGRFNIVTTSISEQFSNGESYSGQQAIMKSMTREVEKHLSRCVKRMKRVFKQYIDLEGYFLVDLYEELKYYLLIARFWRKLKEEGYKVCMPDLSEASEEIHMNSVYNMRLVLKGYQDIVTNDFHFSKEERIYILTGPNRGGKTILTQGIGLAAYMASIGLFVAADSYKGFMIKKIYTHFPTDEAMTVNYGRLGEEAIRIQQIVKEADKQTLVLLNETYSSTCATDGLYLAKDLLHVLKHKNIPTIFNTHLREVAKSVEEMNQWEGDSDIISIIMEIRNGVNTFRALRSEPDVSSYARNIAEKYGITYDQMLKM